MKRTLRITECVLILLLLIYLIAVNTQQNTRDVKLSDVKKSVEKKCDMSEFSIDSSRKLFFKNYGLDLTQYEDAFYYASENVMDVNELLLIKVSDKNQLTDLEAAAASHIDRQIQTFHGYGTDQESLLKNAITFSKGNYFFVAVSKEASTWEEIVLSHIKGGFHGIF